MKISAYKQGLDINGIKMFDNIKDEYQLSKVKDLLLLRIVAENWETLVKTRTEINNPMDNGQKRPHTVNKECKAQMMQALEKLNLWQSRTLKERFPYGTVSSNDENEWGEES